MNTATATVTMTTTNTTKTTKIMTITMMMTAGTTITTTATTTITMIIIIIMKDGLINFPPMYVTWDLMSCHSVSVLSVLTYHVTFKGQAATILQNVGDHLPDNAVL